MLKKRVRIIIPVVIVAAAVFLSAGLAFAREFNFIQASVKNHNSVGLVSAADPKIVSNQLVSKSVDQASTGAGESELQEQPAMAGSIDGPTAPLTASEEASDGEKELVGAVESITAASWKVAGQTFAVTPDTHIDGNIVVGDMVKVELYMDQATGLTASEIELLSGEEEGVTTEFTGTVEAVSLVSVTVSSHVLTITHETEIEDTLAVGAKVKVEAIVNPDGSLTAKEIELLEESDEEGESHEGNCTGSECENEQGDDNHQGQCHEDECEVNNHGDHEGSHDSHSYDFDEDEDD